MGIDKLSLIRYTIHTEHMDSERLLYDADSAARALSLSRSKVYEMMASGELGSVMIGTRRLIPKEALLAFVERLQEQKNGE